MYVFDARTLRLVQVNRSAVTNTGYPMDELHGMTPLDLLPELDAAAFEAIVEPLRSGDVERVQFETVHRRRDGTTYPVEMRMQLVGSESPPVIAAVVQDITARHAAELELRGREAENRRLATEQGALRRVATAVAQEDDPQARLRPGLRGGGAPDRRRERRPGALRGGSHRDPDGRVGGAWARRRPSPPGERLDGDGLAALVARTGRAARLDVPRSAGDGRAADRRGRAGARRRPPLGRHRRLRASTHERAMPDAADRLGRFAELVGIAVSNAEARARLAALAATDHLTGLANHRTFQERLGPGGRARLAPRPPLLAGAARHRPLQARQRRPRPPGRRRGDPRGRPAPRTA